MISEHRQSEFNVPSIKERRIPLHTIRVPNLMDPEPLCIAMILSS